MLYKAVVTAVQWKAVVTALSLPKRLSPPCFGFSEFSEWTESGCHRHHMYEKKRLSPHDTRGVTTMRACSFFETRCMAVPTVIKSNYKKNILRSTNNWQAAPLQTCGASLGKRGSRRRSNVAKRERFAAAAKTPHPSFRVASGCQVARPPAPSGLPPCTDATNGGRRPSGQPPSSCAKR